MQSLYDSFDNIGPIVTSFANGSHFAQETRNKYLQETEPYHYFEKENWTR